MNIVIKLPNDVNERILCFPFIHVLDKHFKKELDEDEILKIHLLCLSDDLDVLNLLPMSAFYHELELSDLKTVFSVHRACATLKIDSVDLFISTTDSFVDASIGKNLGSKKNIGFNVGKNTFLLSEKINKSQGSHFSEQVFQLLRPVIEELPEIPNVFSRELPCAYADWSENPYIVVNLKKDYLSEEWIEFFNLFVNKNFILMCSDEEKDFQKSTLEEFIKKLDQKNTYKVFEHHSNIDFGKVISYCKLFISYDSFLVNLAAYCGTSIVHLSESSNIQLKGSQYFVGDMRFFSLSDPMFKQGNDFNYTKIFDELFSIVEKKLGVQESD